MQRKKYMCRAGHCRKRNRMVSKAICAERRNAKRHAPCYPEGCAAPGNVQCQCNTREPLSKLERASPQRKINVTSKSPVGDISVVTLIRTDTTLDHSQKAEKVWSEGLHCNDMFAKVFVIVISCVVLDSHRFVCASAS